MAKEQIGNRLASWAVRHQAALWKLGAGVGATLAMASVVRWHEQDRSYPKGVAEYFNDLTDGQSPRYARLPENIGGQHNAGRVALLSTDTALLNILRAIAPNAPVAAGWREKEGAWRFQQADIELPSVEDRRGVFDEAASRRSLAAMHLGHEATEAAIGIVFSSDTVSVFQPLDTTLERIVYPEEARTNHLGAVPIIRPIVHPSGAWE